MTTPFSPTAFSHWDTLDHDKFRDERQAVAANLAALPLDPRLARMVVEADRRGVLEEVLVIAAGLTVQDVAASELDRMRAKTKPVYDKFIVDAKLKDLVKRVQDTK